MEESSGKCRRKWAWGALAACSAAALAPIFYSLLSYGCLSSGNQRFSQAPWTWCHVIIPTLLGLMLVATSIRWYWGTLVLVLMTPLVMVFLANSGGSDPTLRVYAEGDDRGFGWIAVVVVALVGSGWTLLWGLFGFVLAWRHNRRSRSMAQPTPPGSEAPKKGEEAGK